MFCEKCGTDNRDNAVTCSRCGEKLPSSSFCGGFADILSYEEKIPASSQSSGNPSTSKSSFSSEKYDDAIRKLIAQNSKLENKINVLSQRFIYVLGGAALALILAFMCLIITPSSKDIKAEIKAAIENDYITPLDQRIKMLEDNTSSSTGGQSENNEETTSAPKTKIQPILNIVKEDSTKVN